MKLVSAPHAVNPGTYEKVLASVVARLANADGIAAVYQVGGVSSPGISDIDVYAVFEDDAVWKADPRGHLDADGRYICVHSQFGASRSHFQALQRFGIFHNYRLVAGTEIEPVSGGLTPAERQAVEVQTGLEYLVKAWLSLAIEIQYGVVRIRNLLLTIKALLHDFHYLGLESGELVDLVHKFVAWRDQWFDNRPTNREIETWVLKFHSTLHAWLASCLQDHPIYVPQWVNQNISRNSRLVHSENLRVTHRGITLPEILVAMHPRVFNLQHRFNRFEFLLPMTREAPVAAVRERHELLCEAGIYNHSHLPHLAPAAPPLAIFSRCDEADT